MFFGREQVNADELLCPKCRRKVFWIFDQGDGPAPGTVILELQCVACKQRHRRTLMRAMNEMANAGEPVELPQDLQAKVPQNLLICGLTQNTEQPCIGVQYRIVNRGNEYFTQCLKCGGSDPIGVEYHTSQN